MLKQGRGKAGPILLITNGHGEDLLAGVLAQALHRRRPDLELWAFPIVGAGSAFRRFPVKVVGIQRRCPPGGWVRQSWKALRTDIQAGFLQLTWQRAGPQGLAGRQVSYTVPVGDIYALS